MLNTVIDKLGTLLSTYFLVGSFFPVLIFAFVNGATLYAVSPPVRRWFDAFGDLTLFPQSFFGIVLLIGLATAAYLFSVMGKLLRELLEGKHWDRFLPPLARFLGKGQEKRRDALQEKFQMFRRERREIKRMADRWRASLLAAREEGKGTSKCQYGPTKRSRILVANLHGDRGLYDDPKPRTEDTAMPKAEPLAEAVKELSNDLKSNHAELRKIDPQQGVDDSVINASRLLDKTHENLLHVIEEAEKNVDAEFGRQFDFLEFSYSRYFIARTELGNIAESVRSYAWSRYGLSHDFFWLRLQRPLQDSPAFYAGLQSAQTQLDFIVGVFWLIALYSAAWLVALPLVGGSVWGFLALAAAAPLLLWGCYRIAVQSYRTFADLLRTSLDLYRMDLIKALRVKPPPHNEAELEIWSSLTRQLHYGEPGGSMHYKHD